jgi:hypothetical protein
MIFLLITIFFVFTTCFSFDINDLKMKFESRFHDRCMKYSFVEKFRKMLENPPDNIVVFVFDNQALDNGGDCKFFDLTIFNHHT